MHEAAKVGNVDILMLLLRNGGRVNHKDVTGVTPLSVATEQGHFQITEVLLSCGWSEVGRNCGIICNWPPLSSPISSCVLIFFPSQEAA